MEIFELVLRNKTSEVSSLRFVAIRWGGIL